jgi:uncharacterized protein YmfQ (DUF2313 family)
MSDSLPQNPVPNAEQDDFADTLVRLQPRGRIWDNGPNSLMAQLRRGQAALMAQFSASLADLTETESYPPTSVLLLPAWEEAFGLPDPCTPLGATIEQRQQAVAARLAAQGGLSIAAIIAVAAALGFTITITEFQPFRAGVSAAGDPCYDDSWAFAWQVNAPQVTIDFFKAGISRAGDPLATWGNTVLQCTLNRIKPPQTILLFNFGSD